MSAFSRLLMVVGSAILAWFIYLQWFYDYARNLPWFPYLMALATFSMFLMFLKNIRRGEVGHLELFGADMEVVCQQGWYWPPSIAPFLQGIDLTFGFDVVSERHSTLGSIAGNPNVYHYHDQNLSSLQFRANTDSLMKANFFHDLNRVKNWIFSIRDSEGRVRYYKVGALLYAACWVFAFFANVGNHTARLASQAMGAAASVVSSVAQTSNPAPRFSEVTVFVQLDAGAHPVVPAEQDFVPTHDRDIQYFFMLEGMKYLKYSEPSPTHKESIVIQESACTLIPAGREARFRADRPPTFTVNMEPLVDFSERMMPFDHTKYLDGALTRPRRTSWKYLHDNWNYAETKRHVFIARAKKASELLEPTGGGLVCF